ncbi:MAG: hypothetical protein LIP08_02935 [Bacteroides sp.]|nr:hypothetical protein [Bacteroides sp.]
MKLILEQLFPTFRDFQESIPGIDANLDFTQLNASAETARKEIVNIITLPVCKKILQEEKGEARHYLQIALGNLTMAKELPFDIIRRRKSDIDIYKNEADAMIRSYTDNYYNAMDSLICTLESESQGPDTYQWKETPHYKVRSRLRIPTTEEFNLYYPIDNSYLFFFRTIPLQLEILAEELTDLFGRTTEKEELTDRLKRALSHLTVAMAIDRFDLQELPATIRNHYSESSLQRHVSNEQAYLKQLAADLVNKATDTIRSIETALSEPASGNVPTQTSFNRPDDKIYLMG